MFCVEIKEFHEFDQRNIIICQYCKDLFDKYGQQDAQIQEPHYYIPLQK